MMVVLIVAKLSGSGWSLGAINEKDVCGNSGELKQVNVDLQQ